MEKHHGKLIEKKIFLDNVEMPIIVAKEVKRRQCFNKKIGLPNIIAPLLHSNVEQK